MPPDSPFAGELTPARARFQRLADIALKSAPAATLNHLAYGMAIALDAASNHETSYWELVMAEFNCERERRNFVVTTGGRRRLYKRSLHARAPLLR